MSFVVIRCPQSVPVYLGDPPAVAKDKVPLWRCPLLPGRASSFCLPWSFIAHGTRRPCPVAGDTRAPVWACHTPRPVSVCPRPCLETQTCGHLCFRFIAGSPPSGDGGAAGPSVCCVSTPCVQFGFCFCQSLISGCVSELGVRST